MVRGIRGQGVRGIRGFWIARTNLSSDDAVPIGAELADGVELEDFGVVHNARA